MTALIHAKSWGHGTDRQHHHQCRGSVLTVVVVGAICFLAIDKFATDRRLANLLKLLVALICLGAILHRILPTTGIY